MNDTTTTAVIDQPAGVSRELLDECHRLCATVAPELVTDAPLYILNRPEGYPYKPSCAAIAICGLVFTVREKLIADGLWRGPGRTILFFATDLRPGEVLGTALHEAAHCFEYDVPEIDCDPPPGIAEWQLTEAAKKLSKVGTFSGLPAWYPSHGSVFIRTCLHLHAEVGNAAGRSACLTWCFAISIMT